MKNVEEKNQSGYVILVNAINKHTSSSSVIGFCTDLEDAEYIFKNIKFKTFQVNGEYVYFLQYLPVVGKIGDNVTIVYIGDQKHTIYRPIYGYDSYKAAEEKCKEIKDNTDYLCAVEYIEKLTKEWADKFKQPPEYSWN